MNIENKIYKRLVEDYGLKDLKMTIELDDNDYSPIVVFSLYTRVARMHLESMEHIINVFGFEKDICNTINLELTTKVYE